MASLFEVNSNDKRIYEDELSDFLPPDIIDIHTHVWLDRHRVKKDVSESRAVSWPDLVAKDNSIEDLEETYRLMFPGKKVTPLIFSEIARGDDGDAMNRYIAECGRSRNIPTLLYSFPEWSGEELLKRILVGGHLGVKVYLNLSPAYIPEAEIRIFDFIPPYQLEVLDRHGMILMLHIPRHGRLRDPVNLAQMMEIDEKYPHLLVIYAHLGRAYCPEDLGDAFSILKRSKHLVMDFCANTQEESMYRALEALGPHRVLFGSDLPILRMRMKRICQDGKYINIVPKDLYGDVSDDPNMREAGADEGKQLSFFMYEELLAFKRASNRIGLNRDQLNYVFYENGKKLLNGASWSVYDQAIIP